MCDALRRKLFNSASKVGEGQQGRPANSEPLCGKGSQTNHSPSSSSRVGFGGSLGRSAPSSHQCSSGCKCSCQAFRKSQGQRQRQGSPAPTPLELCLFRSCFSRVHSGLRKFSSLILRFCFVGSLNPKRARPGVRQFALGSQPWIRVVQDQSLTCPWGSQGVSDGSQLESVTKCWVHLSMQQNKKSKGYSSHAKA